MLTASEAAAQLGITATRVRALIASGRLPAQKFGPIHMIKEGDLRLVENRKIGRPAKPTDEKVKKEIKPRAKSSKTSKKKGSKK